MSRLLITRDGRREQGPSSKDPMTKSNREFKVRQQRWRGCKDTGTDAAGEWRSQPPDPHGTTSASPARGDPRARGAAEPGWRSWQPGIPGVWYRCNYRAHLHSSHKPGSIIRS